MKWKLRYFSPKQTTQELWHHHTKGTLPLQTHLLWINGCDWPEYPRSAGDLCECYGGQIHLSEQMKHELADSSGSQTTLSLKHYRITRVSEGRKKKGERHLETSIIDHFLEESECLFFFFHKCSCFYFLFTFSHLYTALQLFRQLHLIFFLLFAFKGKTTTTTTGKHNPSSTAAIKGFLPGGYDHHSNSNNIGALPFHS